MNNKLILPAEWNFTFFHEVASYIKKVYVSNFIDIGANIGHSTYFFCIQYSIPFQQILAFEPDTDNFNEYILNTSGLPIKTYNFGIFYGLDQCQACGIGDGNRGGYFIEDLGSSVEPHPTIPYQGKIFKLDTIEKYTNQLDPLQTFVKIDVEGSEYNILDNSQFISKCKFLLLELHFRSVDSMNTYVNEYATKHGFRIVTQITRHYFLEKI